MSLKRDGDNGIIGGVCKGIENHTDVDAWVWRVMFIACGAPILYWLMWILIDNKDDTESKD
tara:strand:- start:1021 stop:1203 length:183 start_codon:yes stop_codon:yes gene_type:complete